MNRRTRGGPRTAIYPRTRIRHGVDTFVDSKSAVPAMPTLEPTPVQADDTVPAWLLKLTFAVQYNPNCPSPWLIRMPGFCAGGLDTKKTFGRETTDALGYGRTCEEAALAALAVVNKGRDAFHADMAKSMREGNERRAAAWALRQAEIQAEAQAA